MSLSKHILRLLGWKAVSSIDAEDKCVVCVAPHTSNADLFIGKLAYRSLGIDAGFLMKKEWFRPPLGWFFRHIGGVPVDRSRHTSVTDQMAEAFHTHKVFRLAITPEGTRKPNPDWKLGFYYIALKAGVPIHLAYIDYRTHTAGVGMRLIPTGDAEADMQIIKNFYKDKTGRHPANFVV